MTMKLEGFLTREQKEQVIRKRLGEDIPPCSIRYDRRYTYDFAVEKDDPSPLGDGKDSWSVTWTVSVDDPRFMDMVEELRKALKVAQEGKVTDYVHGDEGELTASYHKRVGKEEYPPLRLKFDGGVGMRLRTMVRAKGYLLTKKGVMSWIEDELEKWEREFTANDAIQS